MTTTRRRGLTCHRFARGRGVPRAEAIPAVPDVLRAAAGPSVPPAALRAPVARAARAFPAAVPRPEVAAAPVAPEVAVMARAAPVASAVPAAIRMALAAR
jgi:hypothetical protein